MENLNSPGTDLLVTEQLEIDEQTAAHLKDAGIWAKAIAVIGTILCILLIIIVVKFSKFFFGPYQNRGNAYLYGMVAGVFILAGLASIFIVNLFRFSSGIATGIANHDANTFEKGISGLRNFFIFTGVFTLILTFIYLLQLIN